MSEQHHSPLPWAIDPDPELDWNFHIVQENAPHMRVCFMTSNGPSQANAVLIVRSVNTLPRLLKALEEIASMTPATSDMTLAHMMGQIAEEALKEISHV